MYSLLRPRYIIKKYRKHTCLRRYGLTAQRCKKWNNHSATSDPYNERIHNVLWFLIRDFNLHLSEVSGFNLVRYVYHSAIKLCSRSSSTKLPAVICRSPTRGVKVHYIYTLENIPQFTGHFKGGIKVSCNWGSDVKCPVNWGSLGM